jgi:hypothetical protein
MLDKELLDESKMLWRWKEREGRRGSSLRTIVQSDDASFCTAVIVC